MCVMCTYYLSCPHSRLMNIWTICQLYFIHPLGEMGINAKLISKMELLLPKLVGEGRALLLAMSIVILALGL